MGCRLERATAAVCDVIADVAQRFRADSIGHDDDLVDDLFLEPVELEEIGLILEEIFHVVVHDWVWRTPFHRTPEALAQWLITESDTAAWNELKRRRA